MSAQPQSRLTEEEYLKFERAAEFRHEYYDGHVVAMSGASLRHVKIVRNLVRSLGNRLDGRDCDALSNDLRVRAGGARSYMYPDVVIVCGTPQLADDHQDTLLNPTLIIEVLSPSTERRDRVFKFDRYRQIDSLHEYALVSQIEPRLEVFRRQPGNQWLFSAFAEIGATCIFDSLGISIPLAEIYHRIELPPESAPPIAESED